MAAAVVPLAADWFLGSLNPAIHALEVARVLALGALLVFLAPVRSERTVSVATLIGIAILAITASRIGVLRGDLGPYLVVTVGIAMACAVGLPWSVWFQAAAALILTGGLTLGLASMGADPWTTTTRNSVFAYVVSMAVTVLIKRLDLQRQHASAEALERTIRTGSELRDLNDRLETRVEQRTLALAEANRELEETNARLASINRDLEAASRELQGFTHSVSHDLRVPLRVIHGLSQLTLEECHDDLGENGRNYLARIGEAAIRLGEIGDDLLTLSRVTRTPIVAERVSVSSLARDVVHQLRAKLDRPDVTVEVHEGLYVDGDRQLLRTALEELLANAWKFTRQTSGARIEVGPEYMDGQKGFFVRDNGQGFPPELAARLFRRFERIHDDEQVEGRGIGLVIVHRIVSRHGGRIRAEGESGRGAIFRVTLPESRSDGERGAGAASSSAAACLRPVPAAT